MLSRTSVFMHHFEKMSASRGFVPRPSGELPLDAARGLPSFRPPALPCPHLEKKSAGSHAQDSSTIWLCLIMLVQKLTGYHLWNVTKIIHIRHSIRHTLISKLRHFIQGRIHEGGERSLPTRAIKSVGRWKFQWYRQFTKMTVTPGKHRNPFLAGPPLRIPLGRSRRSLNQLGASDLDAFRISASAPSVPRIPFRTPWIRPPPPASLLQFCEIQLCIYSAIFSQWIYCNIMTINHKN